MENMKKYMKYVCYLSIGLLLLLKFIVKIDDWMDAISYSISITIAISIGYVTILWKYNPLEKYPRLNKKYSGKIITENYGERDVCVEIKHNLIYTYIKLTTNESKSRSKSFNIYKEGEDWMLMYTYINEPNMLEREHSDIHYGTCVLEIKDKDKLEGMYYTDRKTIGEIKLEKM